MRRTSHLSLILAVAAALVAATAGCNKPSEESCRKAIANMRDLLGTDGATSNADVEGDVRRCKGGSSRKAVDCAVAAKTLEELRACEFMKVPVKKKAAGSADPGSAAAPGSAADPGSAAGSN